MVGTLSSLVSPFASLLWLDEKPLAFYADVLSYYFAESVYQFWEFSEESSVSFKDRATLLATET